MQDADRSTPDRSHPLYVSARLITRMAKDALDDETYAHVADDLGVSPPQISKAVRFDEEHPTRYHALRKRIIERYTDRVVSEEAYWRVESKASAEARESAPPAYEHLPDA